MEYGLLPTEGTLAFLVIIALVYLRKQQFKTPKTKIYKSFIIISIIYSSLVFVSTVSIKYIGENIVTLGLWRLQFAFMVAAWATYYLYGITVMHDIKDMKIMKIAKYNFETKIVFSVVILVTILLLLPVNLPIIDSLSKGSMNYFTKGSALLMLLGTLGADVIYIRRILLSKDKISQDFKFSTAISLSISLICCIIQYHFRMACWVPLTYGVISYITYFMVENPDLILMAETLRLKKQTDSKTSKNNKFLSNLNEDLNTPINKMMELCNQLENEPSNDLKYISEINKEGKRLLETIENILNSLQINSNKTHEIKYDTKELIRNIIKLSQEKLSGKKVKLIINIDTNLSSSYIGDYEKLYQALSNLINYSCNDTKIGKVIISISATKNNQDETLNIKITDSGDGLKEEEKIKMFSENSNEYNNIKLAKQYIELMGGNFWYESIYKMGSKFYIKLKQKVSDNKPIENIENLSIDVKNDAEISYTKYNALIVDDNLSNVKIIEKLLKAKGFEVEIIQSGLDCIRKVKAEEKIDIIFMDIMMPEIDGIETMNVVRALEGYKLPPIVALTANALSGMKEKYISEGFDEYIAKPINKKELDKVIKYFFG